ncbi:hypothetical protein ACFCZT_16980 [Streptomyces sp. NPDC056230]|uniref:hypothetical protein n=1 Tax=Streptomyces sp. NPDC056230 TaxID=3345754 RepID=UPI0035DCC548
MSCIAVTMHDIAGAHRMHSARCTVAPAGLVRMLAVRVLLVLAVRVGSILRTR